jgi:hypothetical protein
MIKYQRLRRAIGKICDMATLMVAGAWLLAQYLVYSDPQFEPALKPISSELLLAFWAAYLLGSYLRPKTDTPSLDYPSPRWSGVSVVVATGVAGAIFVAGSSDSISYVALSAIVVATLVVAALVWRFATLHAADIGEARFVNTGS